MNEFSSPIIFPALPHFIAQCHSRIECRTSTVALEDIHQSRHSRWIAPQQFSFPLIQHVALILCALRQEISLPRRSKRRVLISAAALAKTVRGDEQWTYF